MIEVDYSDKDYRKSQKSTKNMAGATIMNFQ